MRNAVCRCIGLHWAADLLCAALLLLGQVVIASDARAAAAEMSRVAIKITPLDDRAAALTRHTLWIDASFGIEFGYQGGIVTIPMSNARRVSFAWGGDSPGAIVTTPDGKTLQVKVKDPEKVLPLVLPGMPAELGVSCPLKAIQAWEHVEGTPPPPAMPPEGTLLVARAMKGQERCPDIVVHKVTARDILGRGYLYPFVEVNLSGIAVRAPVAVLRSASVVNNDLQVTLQDGTVLRGEKKSSIVYGHFKDMSIEVDDWTSIDFDWKGEDEAARAAPAPHRGPGSVLVVVCTKGGVESPQLCLGSVAANGAFKKIFAATEKFRISTTTASIFCPLSSAKSVTMAATEAVLERWDGILLRGKVDDEQMQIKAEFDGLPASVRGWNKAEFAWRPAQPAQPQRPPVLSLSYKERYYRSPMFPGRSMVFDAWHDKWLTPSVETPLSAEYKGVFLDVSKGCVTYSFNPPFAVLPNGDKAPLTVRPQDFLSLFTEYYPSVPARLVVATADVAQLESAESSRNSNIARDWQERVEASSGIIWTLTDSEKRTYLVKSLRAYQPGKARVSPPPGYVWIPSAPVEVALLPGRCAIVELDKAVAHLPLSVVESIDALNGKVKLAGAQTGQAPLKLRGFCDIAAELDISEYLRASEQEWECSTFVAESELGPLAIPITNCLTIARAVQPRPFSPPAADQTPRTIELRTKQDALTLKEALVFYRCANIPTTPEKMHEAPRCLLLGKDEQDDDPAEFKTAALLLEIPAGPTVSVPLRQVSSGEKKESLFEVSFLDGRKIAAKPLEGSFIGTVPLGPITLPLQDVESFQVQP